MKNKIEINITEYRQLSKKAKSQRADLILLNHQEFQVLFRISARTSQNWRRKFQIPYLFIGSTIYFRLSSILDFMEQNTILSPLSRPKQ